MARLPRFIVIKTHDDYDWCLYYSDKLGSPGYAALGRNSVFSTAVKIEVEPATTGNNNLVHLQFCHVNKYLARNPDDGYVVARSNKPEEDTSKPSCTLFEPTFLNDQGEGVFYLTHVQSRGRVIKYGLFATVTKEPSGDPNNYYYTKFYYVDWNTLVKMPKRVAFKGDNGGYLKAYWFQDLPYLRFSPGDANDEASDYEVHLVGDGHVRIKSIHFGKFLRYGENWIWANGEDTNDAYTLFWPVRIDNNTIALRCTANNNFCRGLSVDWKEDCLNAATPTITEEARLGVQELVLERKIYNVRYRMEDSRIFDEKPFVAGTTEGVNRTDQDSLSIGVEIGFEDERSYSFSRSLSLTAGVTTSIQADLLGIVEGGIEISFGISGSFEWAETKTSRPSVKATGTVPVPARSRAIVHYVGTRGNCNVPFSYIQQDKSSTDGRIFETHEVDGVYTGVNSYNFSFEVLACQPL